MRSCVVILTAAMLLGTAGLADGGETTFLPSPIDLLDLPHSWYFTWGVDFELPEGEVITEAVLTFEGIYD